jgi:hypothetical protein
MSAPGYYHAEAFCHMRYRADDESEELSVWNSRDGVTPFVIGLPSGKPATHVDWRDDRRDPAYVPMVGDWIFVDLTPERARELAGAQAERYWADPGLRAQAKRQFGSVEALAGALTDHPVGAPDLVQVTEELRVRLMTERRQP